MRLTINIDTRTEQAKYFVEFMKTLNFISLMEYPNGEVNENNIEYKNFMESEIKKAMHTERIKSGNSLREII